MHAKETIMKSFVSDGISGMNIKVEAINKRANTAYVDGIDINLRASVSQLALLPDGLCVLMGLSYLSRYF